MELKAMNNGAVKFICKDELEKEVILNNWEKLNHTFNNLIKQYKKGDSLCQ
ncbi:hypothetical protein [Staphylococcus haemolyticus]|uniref:hypothetical protein n=1 Tax=Staphylococcus haemolyticus TaxID=1283 RepID=UPI001F423727|nr:hypothetical protein [Staphylococcus haemolyticus]MCE4993269.1 hypothetical protein [Staphylococcus haemolyticus]